MGLLPSNLEMREIKKIYKKNMKKNSQKNIKEKNLLFIPNLPVVNDGLFLLAY